MSPDELAKAMRIGIDTGGTFTDFVIWDGRRISTRKVRSTPEDPVRAILEVLGGLRAREIVHGSTVATNAVLERQGARTAFVTTAGFEDLLALGRQNRPRLYDFFVLPRARLVPEEWTFGVGERTLYDGSIMQPVEPSEAEALACRLRELRIESVAVCLLHSYANGANELSLAQQLDGFSLSLSHQLLPEYREFERAATTLVNAYISPLISRYLERLRSELGSGSLRIFQSNGGSISADTASRSPIRTVLSGPAGGVLGAAAVAKAAGFERVITFDMGGTSTDVSVYDGKFSYTTESMLGDFPIRVPLLDIHSIGAGGGSIAYLDPAGTLRVGPRSAGARPGPICYGEGTEITVTDANLVLGRIDPERFLSGSMKLDVDRTHHYMSQFARRVSVAEPELAAFVVRVANSHMERAIRAVSVERGYDPRDFALLSFGGAGGQHACDLAAKLEIRTVIVPQHAGVLSALGMLAADCIRDYSQSVLGCDPEPVLGALERQAASEFADEGCSNGIFERLIDMRYRGQSYEITLPYHERSSFHEVHRRLYGYAHPEKEFEMVTARLRATAVLEKIDLTAPADEQTFSSTYIPPGWRSREDSLGNLILTH